MKNILVPTDFSDCASNAAKYALAIAKKFQSNITLYNSSTLIPQMITESTPEDMEKIIRDIERANKEKLENYCKRLFGNELAVACIVQDTNLLEGIQDLCKQKNIDLIVMGTKGESNIKNVLFGSNTSRVINNCDVPILIVPEKAKEGALNKIAFATDYRDSDIESIKELIKLAGIFDASITLLHVAEGDYQEAYEEETLSWFNNEVKQACNYEKLNYRLIKEDDVIEALEKYIDKEQVDLLCMSTMKRNFFEKFINSSLTKTMSFHSKIPLLVFHSFAVLEKDRGDF